MMEKMTNFLTELISSSKGSGKSVTKAVFLLISVSGSISGIVMSVVGVFKWGDNFNFWYGMGLFWGALLGFAAQNLRHQHKISLQHRKGEVCSTTDAQEVSQK